MSRLATLIEGLCEEIDDLKQRLINEKAAMRVTDEALAHYIKRNKELTKEIARLKKEVAK